MKGKLSAFNFAHVSRKGELLAYNANKGTGSFVKILPPHVEKYVKVFSKAYEVDQLSKPELSTMVQRGLVVGADENEDTKWQVKTVKALVNDHCLRLIILPTEECNFRCKYCYESFRKKKMSLEKQNAIIAYVKKNISRYKSLRLSWFGGEPLIAMDVIEYLSKNIMDICRKNRCHFTADITTNGYLLSEDVMRKLLSFKVASYQITIDGLEETHNLKKPLSGGGQTYETIVHNIRAIREHVKTTWFKFTIRTNMTAQMLDELPQFHRNMKEITQGDHRFSHLFRFVGDWGGENKISEIKECMVDQQGPEASNIFKKMLDDALFFGIDAHMAYFEQGAICYAAQFNSFVIDSQGTIRKCTCHLDNEKNAIGELLDDGSMVIDEAKHNQWIQVMPMEGLEKCKELECQKCFFRPNCMDTPCPAKRVIEAPNEHYGCPLEKINLGEFLELMDHKNPDLFHVIEV